MLCDNRLTSSKRYSAQAHGTKPILSASELEDDIFDPLIQTEPDILPLLQLIKANSLSLAVLVDNDRTLRDVTNLEARIRHQRTTTQQFDPSNKSTHSFGKLYGPLAQSHAFWYVPFFLGFSTILTHFPSFRTLLKLVYEGIAFFCDRHFCPMRRTGQPR